MKQSLIYFALSKLNSKEIYIGKTVRTLDERKSEHENSALNRDPSPFHKALIDNGFKNWKWGEIEKCSTDDVFEREEFWIKKNIESGMNVLNVTHAAEEKSAKPIKKSRIGSVMGGKNVWKSDDAKRWLILDGILKPVRNITRKINYPSVSKAAEQEIDSRPGITRSAKTGIPTINNNLYVFLDIENNPILTDGHLKNKTRTKRVKNRNTGKIYNNAKEAAEKNNLSANAINSVCNGGQFTANGYSFCFIDDDQNEILKEKHIEQDNRRKESENRQYAAYFIEDINYEKPMLFDSTKEMAETLNIPQAKIPIVCRGERSHTKGWRIAYYNRTTNQPELTKTHRQPVKKLIRKVKCLDDGLEFDNASKAAKYYQLIRSQIQSVCEGNLKTTNGKKFAYLDRNGNEILTDKHKESLRWKGIPIMCPELGKVFNSIKHFCDETGVPAKRAHKHLKDSSVNLGGLTIHKI